MIKSNIDISKIIQGLSDFHKKTIPAIMTDTVNHIANITAKKVREEMARVFDRPTPYTLQSIFVRPCKVESTNAFAYVGIKDWPDKGIAANQFLSPEIYGGQRNLKRSESALLKRGLLPVGSLSAVPGDAMKLNQYGNVSGPAMVSILSGLKAFGETGYVANRVGLGLRKGVKKSKKKPRQYVVMDPPGKGVLGVYERYGKKMRSIKPLLAFVQAPNYKPRLQFHKIVLDEYEGKFVKLFLEKLQY